MADDASTLQHRGQAPPAPSSLISLDDPTDVVDTPAAPPAEDPEALRTRLADLETQNTRYKQQLQGWETQSRRNLEERNALADRLARLEGRIDATAQDRRDAQQVLDTAPPSFNLKAALDKYINGDDSGLGQIEEALARARSTPQTSQAPPVTEDKIREWTRAELAQLGTRSSVQAIVGREHPELRNLQHPLYAAVYDQYETYAADDANRLMYPKDPQYEIPVPDPTGGTIKMMDARLVRQLAADLKLQGGIQEGRRQEAHASTLGTTQSGNGRATSTPVNRAVEALDLLTEGERREMQNLQAEKAWPADWPKDLKAAAKRIFDGFPDAEKARRLDAYKRTVRTT